ncbi:MAG: SAM-dependent methyltransferase [Muribaculaceae bacterium]|nr:SAM-dependent methyltransferase [Muribaculaceae bacterium]MCM1399007.1 SAM-dependent methyltransferase [Clostridium sp.]MCM1458866.1 SAM-dependent methyltransferase [Bacteroides sp.]
MNVKCQVFTPNDYVRELLDSVGYTESLYGKRILENSCGDGNILVSIVERYIEDCRIQGLTDTEICKGITRDIYGIEIDPIQYKKCIQNLDKLAGNKRIGKVKWNVINEDYLKWKCTKKFQFVVGNPPYITYQELSEEEREFVRKNFETCEKGKFDYCYAFIEKSVKYLDRKGKMSYLIPSSIFKTVFGERLREFVKPYIREIHDYTRDKMFDNALVKSAIMVLDKTKGNKNFLYYDMANKERINIPLTNLSKKWFFIENSEIGTRRFGDYFQVAHVVATLLNDAFVIKKENYEEMDDFYQCNGRNIEKAIVRETATPRSLRYKKEEKIIFPYDYVNGKLIRYTENQFKMLFPGADAYLNDFREQLDKRESDKSALWFEYGRSQALTGLNRRKLLISTVITEKVAVYILKKKCIPYAGMYIVPKAGNRTYKLEDAKDILESDEFMRYVKTVGIHISGASLRITSKDIEEFRF